MPVMSLVLCAQAESESQSPTALIVIAGILGLLIVVLGWLLRARFGVAYEGTHAFFVRMARSRIASITFSRSESDLPVAPKVPVIAFLNAVRHWGPSIAGLVDAFLLARDMMAPALGLACVVVLAALVNVRNWAAGLAIAAVGAVILVGLTADSAAVRLTVAYTVTWILLIWPLGYIANSRSMEDDSAELSRLTFVPTAILTFAGKLFAAISGACFMLAVLPPYGSALALCVLGVSSSIIGRYLVGEIISRRSVHEAPPGGGQLLARFALVTGLPLTRDVAIALSAERVALRLAATLSEVADRMQSESRNGLQFREEAER